jgi:3-isopropylmalate/(R)-2-methylmalate dehydratase small subunit
LDWEYKGVCWKFGDDLGIDGDIMPLEFALTRETNPEVLKNHVMCGVDRDFPKKAKPGDIIVAGRNFGQGNPHIQGLLGIKGLGLGLVAESIPRGSFRNAINAGLPFLTACTAVTQLVDSGDLLEVNFEAGRFANMTRGTVHQFEPLDAPLRRIIAAGGWKPHFKARVALQKTARAAAAEP